MFLYAVDKGLRGWNVLQSVVIDSATHLLKINSPSINNVAVGPYNIMIVCVTIAIVIVVAPLPIQKWFSQWEFDDILR